MKQEERKKIIKCVVGSKLYGTDNDNSDDDYLGIFMPNKIDLLGMQNSPNEIKENIKKSDSTRNTVGDIDCKYFSVKRFFKLAAEGQSIALELFFVPDNKILFQTEEWQLIKENIDYFKSINGIRPFIGFALAQAIKSKSKGENLNHIILLIEKYLLETKNKGFSFNDRLDKYISEYTLDNNYVRLFGVKTKKTSMNGIEFIEIAGRKFNYGLAVKTFHRILNDMKDMYGFRTVDAYNNGYDYKSLYHAYRLLSETEEFLLTGNITFPRHDAEFLKKVRNGDYITDYNNEIIKKIDKIRDNILPKSKLPKSPNWKKINDLCIKLHSKLI